MKAKRAVVDTNVLISAALLGGSLPARLLSLVLQRGCLLFSKSTFAELETRLWRPKFDRYLSIEMRKLLLHDLSAAAQWVALADLAPFAAQRYSRDANDDPFVHLALAGGAQCLISGDQDLLVLETVQGVPVLSPALALAAVENWSER